MARGPKSKRYAQALFTLAEEKGKGQAWAGELRSVSDSLSSKEVELFFTTPRVPADRKLSTARELLKGTDPVVLNLVGLLLSRQAIGLLPEIADEYAELVDVSLGRVHAQVTSAVDVSKDQQTKLQKSLSGALGKEVILDMEQDPAIVGGLLVRVGDQIIDGTVRSRLDALRQRLAHESLV
ncbi:MAG: F0F1 ATP synthase subunit delta [Dehalococcoidia bacterium]